MDAWSITWPRSSQVFLETPKHRLCHITSHLLSSAVCKQNQYKPGMRSERGDRVYCHLISSLLGVIPKPFHMTHLQMAATIPHPLPSVLTSPHWRAPAAPSTILCMTRFPNFTTLVTRFWICSSVNSFWKCHTPDQMLQLLSDQHKV